MIAHTQAVKLGALGAAALISTVLVGVSSHTSGCKNGTQGVQSADQVAIDLTDAVCAPLENQPVGQPWVDFLCTLAEGTEDVISVYETSDAAADAGPAAPAQAIKAKTVRVRVAKADSETFLASHRRSKK